MKYQGNVNWSHTDKLKKLNFLGVRITPELRLALEWMAGKQQRYKRGCTASGVAYNLIIDAFLRTLQERDHLDEYALHKFEDKLRRRDESGGWNTKQRKK